jgi:hypothetical protein
MSYFQLRTVHYNDLSGTFDVLDAVQRIRSTKKIMKINPYPAKSTILIIIQSIDCSWFALDLLFLELNYHSLQEELYRISWLRYLAVKPSKYLFAGINIRDWVPKYANENLTNTDQTPLPTAKQSADERASHTCSIWLGSTDDEHAKNIRSKSPESNNYRTKPSSLIIVRSIWENIIPYVIELTE